MSCDRRCFENAGITEEIDEYTCLTCSGRDGYTNPVDNNVSKQKQNDKEELNNG